VPVIYAIEALVRVFTHKIMKKSGIVLTDIDFRRKNEYIGGRCLSYNCWGDLLYARQSCTVIVASVHVRI